MASPAPPTRLLHDAETALVLGHHMLDFWTNICVCHSLIVHDNPQGGLPLYQVRVLVVVRFHHACVVSKHTQTHTPVACTCACQH